MATCKDVSDFLAQVGAHAVTTALPEPDATRLEELQYVRFLTADGYRDLTSELATLSSRQDALRQEASERAELASELGREYARTHSILFHLHGKEKEAEELDEEAKTRANLQSVDTDFTQKEAAFNELLGKRSVLDTLTPYGDRYVGLTPAGAAALRDLTVCLYRVGDTPFETYLGQAQLIDRELEALSAGGASYCGELAARLPGTDVSYLWAISVGLAKAQPDLAVGVPRFVEAYNSTASLSHNSENRLLTSEILVALPAAPADEAPALSGLVHEVRKIGVPHDSALGVAAIVLFGRRADGSFATASVQRFLQQTRSYEAAALLGIVNTPADALTEKFLRLRAMFSGWGYTYSEDTELSSAYLAVSEYAPEDVASKLAILARGLSAYLQYPLVGASILASLATLEANETLHVVEKAYGLLGARARGLSQSELICVAIRMVHGIRDELVRSLDATATQPAAGPAGGVRYGPHPVFLPVLIANNAYYATFGGIGGAHPGHVHGTAGGFGGVG